MFIITQIYVYNYANLRKNMSFIALNLCEICVYGEYRQDITAIYN